MSVTSSAAEESKPTIVGSKDAAAHCLQSIQV